MKRWYGLDDAEPCRPYVAIGVYDGVHRGHRLLIRRAMADARRDDAPTVVITFDPNPAEIVRPEPPPRLSTLAQRLELIDSLGADATLVLPFDREMSRKSPQQFVLDVLISRLGARGVVVGENFRFGYRASGDVSALREFGGPHGMTVDAVPLFRQELVGRRDVPISSSEIRSLVAQGAVEAATRALARPHRVEGRVVTGDGRGEGLGFPTANIATTHLAAIPADGVYAGRLVLTPYGEDETILRAAISVGTNPTYGPEGERRVEAYALDAPADLDLYDTYAAVDFVARLRDQVTFPDESRLVAAMEKDVAAVRRLLGQ